MRGLCPTRRLAAAGLTALALTGCAVARSTAALRPAHGPAPCGFAQPVKQAADGRVSGCLQVGPFAAGAHHVVLQGALLETVPLSVLKKKYGKVHARIPIPPAEPPVMLTVSPSAGRPGTLVTVTGRVESSRFRHRGTEFPTLCWDSCHYGLQVATDRFRWIGQRAFTARFRVPGAPWVRSHPLTVVPLTPGVYQIGVQCLRSGPGCTSLPAEATVGFELTGSGVPAWCRTIAGCASLRMTPSAARPGQWVRVSGYVPIVSFLDGGPGFISTDVRAGRPHGAAVAFKPQWSEVDLGQAPLRVLRPPSWTSLRLPAPLWSEQAGIPPFTISPADPSTVGYCSGGDAVFSGPGGTTSFSIARAAPVLRRLGFAELGPFTCTTAVPVGSTTVAVFNAGPIRYPAPPFAYVALSTPDRGSSWTPVPVPARSASGLFGGVRDGTSGQLEAVFAPTVTPHAPEPAFPGPAGTPLVEATRDGMSWRQVPLACPESGPCMQLGAAAWARCMATGAYQEVLRPSPPGRHWTLTPTVDWANGCAQATVVATGARTALLINSLSQFPLSETRNGGRTWFDIGVPAIHGRGYMQGSVGPGGLTLLPSGALLDSGDGGSWRLLAPGAGRWCEVTGVPRTLQAIAQNGAATFAAGQLWWQVWTDSGTGPVAKHVPLTALTC